MLVSSSSLLVCGYVQVVKVKMFFITCLNSYIEANIYALANIWWNQIFKIWGKKSTQTNGNVAYYPLLTFGDEVFLVSKWFSFKSPLYVFCMLFVVEAEQYCLCNQPEFGLMVACDKMDCTITWFHLACVGLKAAPKGKWICPRCEYIPSIFYSISTIV